MSSSLLEFVGLVVLAAIVVLSLAGFAAFADQDYRLKHTETTDSVGRQDPVRNYEFLDETQRRIFAMATETGRYVAEDSFEFPKVVYRNGTYYRFRYTSAFDWTNPTTTGPALALMGGLVGIVALLRRSVR